MDLFRIVLPWERKSEVGGQKSAVRERVGAPTSRRFALIGALVLLLIIGFGWWWTTLSHKNLVSRASEGSQPQSIPEKSIAVLPFENLSEEKQNEYFADGVQDQILTDLSQIADLKVISRTSVMQYKAGAQHNLREIGQQLGVAHVVEGSVQRAANKIRVNAQLIDARTDAHLWAQTYDRDLADVFAIQSEIAKAIADQLQAKLSPNEKNAIEERPTTDITAFDLYSRGKTLLLYPGAGAGVEVRFREGIELLKSAVARDPTFHAAFCQLVFGNDRLYANGYDHTPERLSAAESALRVAEKLKPDSPETHLARADHLYYGLRDYEGAQAQLEIAGRGLPNDSRIPELKGYIVRRKGKTEEGLRLLKQATTLDPRNVYLLEQIAVTYSNLRQYAEAAEAYDRALEIKPDDLAFRVFRTQINWQGHADPAPMCQLVEQVRLNTPGSVSDVADNWFHCALAKRDWAAAEQALAALGDNPCWSDNVLQFNRQFGEGLLARAMHHDARARRAFTAARVEQEQLVQKQKGYGPPLCVLGLIDAALGNKEAALQEGRRAMELLPREKDAINGEMLFGYFAVIAAWAGEKDLALQQLNAAISLPGAAYITSYGFLKLLPFWDPLRGDPRFDKIVASLAPKEEPKR
jgi:TolB-like protein